MISYVAYGYDYYRDYYWSGQVIVADAGNPGDYRIVAPDYSSVYAVEWLSNRRLAFGSDRTGFPELYAANDDGTAFVQLTNGIGFTGSFAVAPGGSAIAVVLDVAGVRDLFRINADGSGLRPLTSNGGYRGGRITWSPDATRLIFDCSSEVCSVNADGSGLTQLTSGGGVGGTCTFNSSGSTDDGPLRFSWIFGDGGTDNYNANPSHRYYAPGTNQVTLTVADMVGQTATFTDTVNVNPERMHVGDPYGSRTEASRGWWYPTVTVTVHGADDRRLLNVLVTGRWSTGDIASCWTDAAGQCSVTGPYARGNNGPSFTVENLSHEALAYGPSANHDPDGDSNGTTLSVTR